ncbi:hypothetical protein [Sideroxydans sp.]
MKFSVLIKLLPSILLVACISATADTPSASERGILSTKTVNLSSAVDIYFSDFTEEPKESVATTLKNATQHDKRLLDKVFSNYELKVQYQNPYAVLLICSKDGRSAIMEDAGCSARIDRQVTSSAPCEFTLKVTHGCTVDGGDK